MRGTGSQEPTPSVQPNPLWHPVLTELGNAHLVSRPVKNFFLHIFSVLEEKTRYVKRGAPSLLPRENMVGPSPFLRGQPIAARVIGRPGLHLVLERQFKLLQAGNQNF